VKSLKNKQINAKIKLKKF